MTQQLMKLNELGGYLGYSDLRSTESWCKKNMIPIIPAGKQKYVPTSFVEKYFNDKIKRIVSNNPEHPKVTINGLGIGEDKNQYYKKTHSKTTQNFLNNIKQ